MGSSIAQNVNYGSVLNMLAQEENNVQTVSHIHWNKAKLPPAVRLLVSGQNKIIE